MASDDKDKHPGGRPRIFDNPEDLAAKIQDYFFYDEVEERQTGIGTVSIPTGKKLPNRRPTLAGLAYALGIDRQTLYNYAERDEFFDIIKKARCYVEMIYEERLVWDGQISVIFPLKNMGWKDKTETELSGNLDLKQITGMELKG